MELKGNFTNRSDCEAIIIAEPMVGSGCTGAHNTQCGGIGCASYTSRMSPYTCQYYNSYYSRWLLLHVATSPQSPKERYRGIILLRLHHQALSQHDPLARHQRGSRLRRQYLPPL